MKKFIFISLCLASLIACSESEKKDDVVEPQMEDTAEYKAAESYYNNTLKTLLTNNCISCHSGYHSKSNASAYGTFTNAKNRASGMYNQVNSGNMPVGGDKLSEADIAKFEAFLTLVQKIN